MSAPEPRANPDLFGHEEAELQVLSAWRSGRLHHGWLLTGPDGIGKATLAFRIARRLLAGLPDAAADTLWVDPAAPVFRRVAASAHADLLTIERAFDPVRKRMRQQIAVDDVRRLAGFMALTPAEGGWRVVVIDGADDLNTASANALLKTLEEPPPRAILLLTCAAPGRLPPTIRSRVRRLRLNPLPQDAMDRAMALVLPDTPPDQRARLAALAEGSPGRALLLAEAEGLRLAALVDEVIAELPTLSPARAYAVADALGRGDDAFSTFMDLLRAAVAGAVREDARAGRMASLAAPVSVWADRWQALTRLQDEAERFSLDRRQAVVTGLGILAGERS